MSKTSIPTCVACDAQLRPWPASGPTMRRGYGGDGLFCSLRCGWRWATVTVQHHLKTGALKR